MNTRLIKTLQHVRELITQAPLLEPEWESKDECYQWVEGVVKISAASDRAFYTNSNCVQFSSFLFITLS